MTETKRSTQQNKAMHVYFAEMAQVLNEAGLTMQLLTKDFDIDVTDKSLKQIWQTIGKQKFNKEHTSDFTSTELQAVYEEFNRKVTAHGFHLPFPSQEAQYWEQYENNN